MIELEAKNVKELRCHTYVIFGSMCSLLQVLSQYLKGEKFSQDSNRDETN